MYLYLMKHIAAAASDAFLFSAHCFLLSCNSLHSFKFAQSPSLSKTSTSPVAGTLSFPASACSKMNRWPQPLNFPAAVFDGSTHPASVFFVKFSHLLDRT